MNELELLDALQRTSQLNVEPPLTALGSGFHNRAYRSSDGWLIRVGLTDADGSRLIEEARLLERIGAAVTVPVPEPVIVEQSETFPTGVMVYRCLPGIALDPAHPETLTSAIAQQLGEALVELHEVAPQQPVPAAPSQNWREWLASSLEWLDPALGPDERSTLAAWLADVQADGSLEQFTPCVVHGDLWFDHVLIDRDQGRITGLVDFGDAGLGDPAQDLATQLHMGREFFDRVFAAYASSSNETVAELQARVERRWELREFQGIWWAWKHGDRGEFEDALRKLRRGPVFGS